MRNSLLVCALLLTTAAASCFNAELTGVNFTCDPPLTGACPDGQQCNSVGACVPGADSDGGTGPGTDMTNALALQPAEGCPLNNGSVGLGFDVTANGKPTVYACPVKFTNKPGQTADVQCKAPYVLCGNANNIDLTACTNAGKYMSGYFISGVPSNRRFTGQHETACGPAGSGQNTMWSGCGRAAVAVDCMGFKSGLECSNFGTFTCQGSKIGDAINTDGASGVLCCKP